MNVHSHTILFCKISFVDYYIWWRRQCRRWWWWLLLHTNWAQMSVQHENVMERWKLNAPKCQMWHKRLIFFLNDEGVWEMCFGSRFFLICLSRSVGRLINLTDIDVMFVNGRLRWYGPTNKNENTSKYNEINSGKPIENITPLQRVTSDHSVLELLLLCHTSDNIKCLQIIWRKTKIIIIIKK